MSKRKLLIQKVFEKIKSTSAKDSKNGWATDLSDELEEKFNFQLSPRTLVRYYDAFILKSAEETSIENLILDKLSEYLGYKDFKVFSNTLVKEGDDANKTTVKVEVDQELSMVEKIFNIVVNITNTNSSNNEQNLKIPDYIKQNGLGIMEIILLGSLITGSVFFAGSGKDDQINPTFGFFGNSEPEKEKECMYWDGKEYNAVYCDDINPQLDLVAIDTFKLKYLKKITRPDTLTTENAIGKVWYDKTNNNVEFFTSYGKHPENDKALKDVTERILNNYAGIESK